jgi:hypothetical protein
MMSYGGRRHSAIDPAKDHRKPSGDDIWERIGHGVPHKFGKTQERSSSSPRLLTLCGGHQYDRARPVLDALLLPPPVFLRPQITVANYQSRNRLGERHTPMRFP